MISVWQSQIVELENKKERLISLKVSISDNAIPNITKVKDSLFDANTILKSAYTVNNETADANSVNNNFENLENLEYNILNNVIPSIDSEISNINSKIGNLNCCINNEYKRIAAAKGGKGA